MSVAPVRPSDPFGIVDFSTEGGSSATPRAPGVPSGDIQFVGPVIIPEPTLTTGDQALTEMLQFRGSPLPLAEQVTEGLDQERMDALIEDCDNGRLSINDLAMELTILILNNALENKCIERQIRSELTQIRFVSDMEMAKMIEEKGELAFKKTITSTVTKVVSTVAVVAIEETANYIANRKKEEAGVAVEGSGGSKEKDFKYTKPERDAIIRRGQLTGKLSDQVSQAVGEIIAADSDLEMSKLDAQMKKREAMNKLMDSIANSVESSIRAQEQAIQFSMGMLDKINSLAHDSVSRIIGNMR
jgi:hypothetical protein